MAEHLTIGRVAHVADVHVETIRYYERRGLLTQPVKPPSGQRHYSEDVVRRVRFIKRAQQMGFTLEEVKGLLCLEDGRSCERTRLLAEEKLIAIEQRLAQLAHMRRMLMGLIADCRGGKRPHSCPIIDVLSA